MERDVNEFLVDLGLGELIDKGLLRGETRLLNYKSVPILLDLMREKRVERIYENDRDWSLTSDEQFTNPMSLEEKSGSLEDLEKKGNIFRGQNVYINPHYEGSTLGAVEASTEDDDETDGRIFALERNLQEALKDNIGELEEGLEIISGGIEKSVKAGRIDILAKDEKGRRVVIELKADMAPLPAMGQILSYMGSLPDDPEQPVRGILVANKFHRKLVFAAKAVSNVKLVKYSFDFKFEPPLPPTSPLPPT